MYDRWLSKVELCAQLAALLRLKVVHSQSLPVPANCYVIIMWFTCIFVLIQLAPDDYNAI